MSEDCNYSMCGAVGCVNCYPPPTIPTIHKEPIPRGVGFSAPIRRDDDQPMALDYDGRKYVCIDPDEWARVQGAARQWSLLVRALSLRGPTAEDASPLTNAVTRAVYASSAEEAGRELSYARGHAADEATEAAQ